MIPRSDSKPSLARRAAAPFAAFLRWWQGVLGSAIDGTAEAAHVTVDVSRHAVEDGREFVHSGALRDLRHPVVAWAGGAAVAIGAVAGWLLAEPGIDRRSAALAGLSSALWAIVRWLIARYAEPRVYAEDRPGLRGSLALGLLVYAVAVTPELRALAWLGSAALTAWALLKLGRTRAEVQRVVGFAWGAQALVALGGWIARNAFVAYVLLRG